MVLLQMADITKSFGPNRVLQRVSLELATGEVLGLVGENGAGKSTLIKILSGAYMPDSGQIALDGAPLTLRSPADSVAAGIAVIYQELTMVPEMTVAENIFLGHTPRVGGSPFIDRHTMERQTREVLQRLNITLDPRTPVGRLSPGYQQMIEIGRALNRNARILVMDEPTSSLSEHEIDQLYTIVRRLKEQGIGIIYISHHLEEIFAICDRVMVLRDGQTVAERPVIGWTSAGLVQAMVNRTIDQFYPYRPRPLGEPILTVTNLQVAPRIVDVTFTLRRGEILGIAGTVGSGRSDILKAIFGAQPYQSGAINWNGRPLHITVPHQAIAEGIVLVPGDRKAEGLMLDANVAENIAASIFNRLTGVIKGFVGIGQEQHLATTSITRFKIAAQSIQMPVRQLSGGNQQKVVFARTQATKPLLALLDEPTRGVDVGAKVEIYTTILGFVEAGGSVILVSSDLPELLGIADRILVVNGGRIVGDLSHDEATHEHVLHLSTDERLSAQNA